MTRAELVERSFARRASVPYARIRSGDLTRDHWTKITTEAGELARLPLLIDDASGLTPARMRSKLRRHVAEIRKTHPNAKLGAVVVDHLQLMDADGQHQNRNDALAEITRGLKRIAKDFSVPVMALSQLNRAGRTAKDRRPTLEALRDCGAIEADADGVLFIHREDEYRRIEERKGDAEFILAKGRACGSSDFQVRFDASRVSFFEDTGFGYGDNDQPD